MSPVEWWAGQGDESYFAVVRADGDFGGPDIFAHALGENNGDRSHGLIGLGNGAHAFDAKLCFERVAYFADGFVIERRVVGDFERDCAGAGG